MKKYTVCEDKKTIYLETDNYDKAEAAIQKLRRAAFIHYNESAIREENAKRTNLRGWYGITNDLPIFVNGSDERRDDLKLRLADDSKTPDTALMARRNLKFVANVLESRSPWYGMRGLYLIN